MESQLSIHRPTINPLNKPRQPSEIRSILDRISLLSPVPIIYNENSSLQRFTRAGKKIQKVVTTLKNSRPLKWTWSGTRFTRQKPWSKRFENQKRSLRYKRARYYSAQLGRFISRDPLGFVDGMNRYRAYFVPGGVDPIGLKSFMECVDDWGWDQFGCKTTFEADLAKCNSGWFYQDVRCATLARLNYSWCLGVSDARFLACIGTSDEVLFVAGVACIGGILFAIRPEIVVLAPVIIVVAVLVSTGEACDDTGCIGLTTEECECNRPTSGGGGVPPTTVNPPLPPPNTIPAYPPLWPYDTQPSPSDIPIR